MRGRRFTTGIASLKTRQLVKKEIKSKQRLSRAGDSVDAVGVEAKMRPQKPRPHLMVGLTETVGGGVSSSWLNVNRGRRGGPWIDLEAEQG